MWLDWEDERGKQPGGYAPAEGPNLVTVLDALQRAVRAACGEDSRAADRADRAFDPYRRGAARTEEYARRFADVIAQSGASGSPFTAGDVAVLGRSAAAVALPLLGLPGGAVSPDQLVESVQAAGRLSAAATRYVTGKKPDEISQEDYDLVTNMDGELNRRAATALRAVAEPEPLLMLLDAGE